MTLAEQIIHAGRVYVIGNGGSHANAMHLCNDLLACGIRAYTIDLSTLSALANDEGWEHAYALWLTTVGEQGDLLIALSGSGKSPNILNAVDVASKIGMMVHRIFGNERGEDMQEAEEMQLTIGHQARACLLQKT
jgi:D-sedoheptulose 7-phosphate isomerase